MKTDRIIRFQPATSNFQNLLRCYALVLSDLFSICVWNCNTHKIDFRLRKSDLKATPCPFELDPWVFRPIPLLSIFSCSSEGGVKEQQVGTGNGFKEDPSWPSYLTMHELTQWSSHVLVRTAGANDLAGFTPQPVIGNCNRQGHRAHEKRSLVCWSLSLFFAVFQ